MVSVLEEKIHARGARRFEELVHEPRTDGGLDDRERAGEQEFALGVGSKTLNAPHGGGVCAPTAMVQTGEIVGFRRSIDADGHAGTGLGKEVEEVLAEERPVGLDADGWRSGDR